MLSENYSNKYFKYIIKWMYLVNIEWISLKLNGLVEICLNRIVFHS